MGEAGSYKKKGDDFAAPKSRSLYHQGQEELPEPAERIDRPVLEGC